MKHKLCSLSASATVALLLAAPLAFAQQGPQQDQNTASQSQSTSEGQQASGGELSDHTVAVIQHNLKRLGFYQGSADGQWSPDVENALQSFQSARGLNANGKVDIESLAALGIIGGMPRMAVMGRNQGQGAGSSMGPQRGMMMGQGMGMMGQGTGMRGQGSGASGQGMGMRGQGSGSSGPGAGMQVYRVPPGYILVPEQGQQGNGE